MKYLLKLLNGLNKNKAKPTTKFVKECISLVEKVKFDPKLKKKISELILLAYRQTRENKMSLRSLNDLQL